LDVSHRLIALRAPDLRGGNRDAAASMRENEADLSQDFAYAAG
jgi:hypothetical protein